MTPPPFNQSKGELLIENLDYVFEFAFVPSSSGTGKSEQLKSWKSEPHGAQADCGRFACCDYTVYRKVGEFQSLGAYIIK